MRLALLAVCFAIAVLSGLAAAQQPAALICLHGSNESAAERDRRNVAIRVVRAINTAEANGPKPFRPFGALNIPADAGWEVHFVTDGTWYAFSVKDRVDPCGFALFSDDRGVIHHGESLR